MSETARTAFYVAVAALLGIAAWAVAPSDEAPPIFDDQGQPFFPGFDDPVGTPEEPAVTSLEVIGYAQETASAQPTEPARHRCIRHAGSLQSLVIGRLAHTETSLTTPARARASRGPPRCQTGPSGPGQG